MWASLAAGAVLLASRLINPSTLPFGEVCLSQRLLDQPCGGCGLTRAFFAISHGHFSQAFDLNPFSFLLYATTVLMLAWPLLRRLMPEFSARLVHPRLVGLGTILLAASMMAYGLYRALHHAAVLQ